MAVSMKGSGPAVQTAVPRGAVFVTWLRKVHGWIGLWGAALGLLFGTSGIVLNHRAVMKIEAAQTRETSAQVELPTPAPANAEELAKWLQAELKLDKPASRVREEPAKKVPWGDATLKQPARWQISFAGAAGGVQAEYWAGGTTVSVKRSENNFWAVLNNLHKGTGASTGWILLADTLAGSIILLSITGLILWTKLNAKRMVGAALGFGSFALLVVFGAQSM